MGCSSYGYGLIGWRLDNDAVKKRCQPTAAQNCRHRKPDGAKFCPECGQKIIKAGPPIEPETLFKGTDIVVIHETDQRHMFIATKDHIKSTGDINAGGGHERIELPADLAKYRAYLHAAMTVAGVADNAVFGFWVIGYCSY